MKRRYVDCVIFSIALALTLLVPVGFGESEPNESTRNLDAVEIDFEAVRSQVQVKTTAGNDVVVGFATSMEKILPRVGARPLQMKSRFELELARNETESFQVIVLPCHKDIKQVRVRIMDLISQDGGRFSAENVDTVPMGYVETKAVPRSGSPHVGWWPDPILNFMQTADIAKGDAQSFWIRLRAPKDQAPNVYKGKLDILIEECVAFSFDLSVRVYGFSLPDTSPLPLAVTFCPRVGKQPGQKAGQTKLPESEGHPVNAWRKHKQKWADFLADYYLTYDNLYGTQDWSPDFEIIERLHKEERLGRFNLGYYSGCWESPEQIEGWRENVLNRIRPAYEEARQLGLLDHAYIYGCDCEPPELFPQIQRAAAFLKAEFPGVMVMTTAEDPSYGMGIQSIDAFCPTIPRFGPDKATRARARGKQVWWCIYCSHHHPNANMFIEYPAIEGRLLMGAMTAKYRPDGFLYYQISAWNSQKSINTGPFTDWDPRSWRVYNGDGSWTCVGPDGTPLPTIRLENFRDGLEDYAYYLILEAAVAKVETSTELRTRHADWLSKAKSLLVVPEEVVKSLTEFTDDPVEVYRYRKNLANAIEAATTLVKN